MEYWHFLHSNDHLTPSTFLPVSLNPLCSFSVSLPLPLPLPLYTNFLIHGLPFSAMKLININPKNLRLSPKRFFRSKKERSTVSRSDPSSFSSGTSSSSSEGSNHKAAARTPTSVLHDVSGDWSDYSTDTQYELVQAFKLIDRDNDGVISREELETLLTRLGAQPLSQEEVKMMLGEVDRDGHGCISVEALMNQVGSACGPVCDSVDLREAFDVFDTDQDGRISAEELLRVFKAIGDERCTLEECRRMIEGVDRNGEGFVCFEDFSRMMELQT